MPPRPLRKASIRRPTSTPASSTGATWRPCWCGGRWRKRAPPKRDLQPDPQRAEIGKARGAWRSTDEEAEDGANMAQLTTRVPAGAGKRGANDDAALQRA